MLVIRKAAVLGAGRMGTAVAAHLANAGIPTLLLDLAPTELTEEEKKKGLDLKQPGGAQPPGHRRHRHGRQRPAGRVRSSQPRRPAHPGQLRGRSAQAGRRRLGRGSRGGAPGHQAGPSQPGGRARGSQDHRLDQLVGPVGQRHGRRCCPTRSSAASWAPTSSSRRATCTCSSSSRARAPTRRWWSASRSSPSCAWARAWCSARTRPTSWPTASASSPRSTPSTPWTSTASPSRRSTRPAAGPWPARSPPPTAPPTWPAPTCSSYAVASHYETAVDDEMREQWRLPQWILDMVAKGYLGEKTGGSFFREKRTLVHRPGHPGVPALAGPAADQPGRGQQDLRPGGPGEEVHLLRRRRGSVRLGSPGGHACLLRQPRPRDLRRHRPDRPVHALGLRLGSRPVRAVGCSGRQGDGRAHAGRGPGGAGVGGGTGRHPTSPYFYKKDTDGLKAWGPGQKSTRLLAARARTIVLADLKASRQDPGRERACQPRRPGRPRGLPRVPHQGQHGGRGRAALHREGHPAGRRRLRRAGHRQPGLALLGRRRPQDDGRQDPGRGLGRHRRTSSAPSSG